MTAAAAGFTSNKVIYFFLFHILNAILRYISTKKKTTKKQTTKDMLLDKHYCPVLLCLLCFYECVFVFGWHVTCCQYSLSVHPLT